MNETVIIWSSDYQLNVKLSLLDFLYLNKSVMLALFCPFLCSWVAPDPRLTWLKF